MCWTLFARLRSFRIRLGGIFYGCRFCERSLIVMFNVNYCDVFNIKPHIIMMYRSHEIFKHILYIIGS